MDKKTRQGLIFVSLFALGYGFLAIWIKLAYQYSDLNSFEITAWRFMVGVPFLWTLLYVFRRTGKNASAHEKLPRLKLFGLGILLAIGAMCVAYGLGYIDASIYIVLFRTQPAMVLIFSTLLGERIPLRGWFALALVMAGIVFIKPEVLSFSLQGEELRGALAALLNAFAIALYNIGQGRIMAGYRSKARATAWVLTSTLMVVFPVVMLMGGLSFPQNWQTWTILLLMGIFSTALPIIAIFEAMERIGTSRFVLIGSIEPVIGLFLAFLILGDALMPIQFIGAVMILSSIFVLEAKFPKRKHKEIPLPMGGD